MGGGSFSFDSYATRAPNHAFSPNPQIALTCTDHVSETMVADLIPRLPFTVKYISAGDTRQHVSIVN